MTAKLLVAYATSYGSTREIAEVVAEVLRDKGYSVSLEPMKQVRTLADFSAVVMGAPFYMFRWHKDARSFLAHHRAALQALPAAVFALGPFNDVEKEWQDVRAQLDKLLAKNTWFTPVAWTVFGGKFDPAGLRFPYTMLPALKQIPATDIRNWDDIRAWADSLPALFQPGQ